MANPHDYTYYSVSEKIAENTIRLDIKFTRNYDGISNTSNFNNNNIRVIDWGSLSWEYDLDDMLMVPGVLEFELYDGDGALKNEFFILDTDKRPLITLYIDSVIEFIGNIDEESVIYDEKLKTIKLTAVSRTDIINKQSLYDLDNNSINPFSYIEAGYYKVTRIIEDIFQLVDVGNTYASGRINILHNWLFVGKKTTGDGSLKYDFDITDIELLIGNFYFDNSQPFRTTGDILRQLALDFGCMIGMVHNKKAFLRQLFYYDSSNTQSLGEIYSHKSKYYAKIFDYVRASVSIGSTTLAYDEGTYSGIEESTLDIKSLFYFYNDEINTSGYLESGTRCIVDDGEYLYNIYGVKDTSIDSNWHDQGDLIAKFWHKYRSNIKTNIIDSFIVHGIGYDFLKNFTYNSNNYMITRLVKKLNSNESEIEALRI